MEMPIVLFTHTQDTSNMITNFSFHFSGDKDIPVPVCALQRCWQGDDDTIAANYLSKVGVNSYDLQWESLKPFQDSDIYITGDTFSACTKTGILVGWSEGVLLHSERILASYFGVDPYMDGLELLQE